MLKDFQNPRLFIKKPNASHIGKNITKSTLK